MIIVSTVISHVIGTAALLTIFFSVGSYYQGFYAIMGEKSSIIQLNQVASYISTNFVDVVTLCQTVDGDQFVVKLIDIPYSINDNLYNCSLNLVPSENSNLRLVASINKHNLYGIIDLPWSYNSTMRIYSNETIPQPELMVSNQISSNKVASIKAVTKDPASFIIWCLKKGNTYTIGFGVMIRS